MWTTAPGWHWLAMAGLWLTILLVAIWAATRLFPASGPPRPTARAILDERLARGELDVDEYRRLRDELQTSHGQGRRA